VLVISVAIILATPRFYYLPVNTPDDTVIALISILSFALTLVTLFFKKPEGKNQAEVRIRNSGSGNRNAGRA
jgi:hypothetical protein